MKKAWLLSERTKDDLIEHLLANRGISDAALFLKPNYAQLHDPWQLKNMLPLVKRLELAIARMERIAIFGDYDHDGTPAAALLADGITACGGQIAEVYIPARDEGYGLNQTVVEHFAASKIKLLIAVDCGITNKLELDYATHLGIDSLVIDHHLVQADKFPVTALVVNPKQLGDTYPYKELCACGLAFKVVQALGEKTMKIAPGQLKWYLDLVAISTICDMVPLTEENRILTYFGLIVLRQTKRLGLKKLFEASGIDPARIDSYTVGFGIGPRLNAPGRMEKASLAYELLACEDEATAAALAGRLNILNRERQAELDRVFAEAESRVVSRRLEQRKLILVSGDAWPDGIVGLVAGRLMEKYHRPSVVLSVRSDGLAKGSARSFGAFHLVEALRESESLLLQYGGHAKAAGLTLAKADVPALYERLLARAERLLTDATLYPKTTVEAILQPNEQTLGVAQKLARFEPFGYGNPRPVLLLPNVEVAAVRAIGETRKHLKLQLSSGGKTIDSVAFGLAARQAECSVGTHLDTIGMLEVNEWQGRRHIQWKMSDWRAAENKAENMAKIN